MENPRCVWRPWTSWAPRIACWLCWAASARSFWASLPGLKSIKRSSGEKYWLCRPGTSRACPASKSSWSWSFTRNNRSFGCLSKAARGPLADHAGFVRSLIISSFTPSWRKHAQKSERFPDAQETSVRSEENIRYVRKVHRRAAGARFRHHLGEFLAQGASLVARRVRCHILADFRGAARVFEHSRGCRRHDRPDPQPEGNQAEASYR